MISPELRFEGFDARSWTNLLSLFAPGLIERMQAPPPDSDAPEVDPHEPEREGDHPRGTICVVVDAHDRPLAAFHGQRGHLRHLEWLGPDHLQELCDEYGARRCLVIRAGVPEEIAERLAMRVQRGDDYVTQWLKLLEIVREFRTAGLIRIHPPLTGPNVQVPAPGMVRRALDVVLPDDRTMVAMVWDGSATWTALALRRRAGAIDLVAGPDLIARWTGPLGGDWRRDYRVVSDAVSRALAPVHLGIFAEADTIRTLLRDPDPGAWARAVVVRDVIVHPTPPYVAVALGADAVRAVAKRSASLFGGLDALGALAPLAQAVRSRIEEVTSVTATLGFNPLRALAHALRRAAPEREDHADALDDEHSGEHELAREEER